MLGFNTGPHYYKGYYNLFHQYNQSMPLWGPNMSWAYVVSKHLIHWLYLEIVLEPDYGMMPWECGQAQVPLTLMVPLSLFT